MAHAAAVGSRSRELPHAFCWTRYGDEAGETVESIIRRKELERRENGGIFLWGVGNNIGRSMTTLIAAVPGPSLLFSPMKSQPRARDQTPREILMWCEGVDLDGRAVRLPERSLVTSGSDGSDPKDHFALVCASDEEFTVQPDGPTRVFFSQLRNIASGRGLAGQQVTAAVRIDRAAPAVGTPYRVTMSVKLVKPFFIRLSKAVAVPRELCYAESEHEAVARRERLLDLRARVH
jgi:hypothetical protein